MLNCYIGISDKLQVTLRISSSSIAQSMIKASSNMLLVLGGVMLCWRYAQLLMHTGKSLLDKE